MFLFVAQAFCFVLVCNLGLCEITEWEPCM